MLVEIDRNRQLPADSLSQPPRVLLGTRNTKRRSGIATASSIYKVMCTGQVAVTHPDGQTSITSPAFRDEFPTAMEQCVSVCKDQWDNHDVCLAGRGEAAKQTCQARCENHCR